MWNKIVLFIRVAKNINRCKSISRNAHYCKILLTLLSNLDRKAFSLSFSRFDICDHFGATFVILRWHGVAFVTTPVRCLWSSMTFVTTLVQRLWPSATFLITTWCMFNAFHASKLVPASSCGSRALNCLMEMCFTMQFCSDSVKQGYVESIRGV